MNASETLRSIRHELLSYIQEKVRVDFDNSSQRPLHFLYKTQNYTVREVLGRFRVRDDSFANGFLLRADDEEIYFLYFHESMPGQPLGEGSWVLSFRVLSDRELMSLYREERQMIVNVTVKKVVDFHGHLCPELVIGMKACEYAMRLLFGEEKPAKQVSVIAENSTSALDAFQVLLGVTVGNQCLKVLDFGKHNYAFSLKDADREYRLKLRPPRYYAEQEYAVLEEKILKNKITLDEVVQFQEILDVRVANLLSSRPEDLFDVEAGRRSSWFTERPTVYVSCSKCGQQVLRDRTMELRGELYCIPCSQTIEHTLAGRMFN